MDNKITKKRLSDLLSYDWILLLVFVIGAILVWEFIFTITSVKITTGQTFYYFVDENVLAGNEANFKTMLDEQDTFGYDIIKYRREILNPDYNVLSTRLETHDGDAVITDFAIEKNGKFRAQNIIDDDYIFSLNDLLQSAKEYISGFKTNGVLNSTLIENHFYERMKGDNRYRSALEKSQGVKDEIKRAERLDKEINDFERLLTTADDSLFFCYTKYEQYYNQTASGKNKDFFQTLYQGEIDNGRENIAYGINLGALNGFFGKESASNYFVLSGTDSAEGLVLLVVDMLEYQPDEQFEVIKFINSIVRNCSDYLD